MKSSSTSGGNNDEVRVANGILVVDEDPLICEPIRDVLESAEIKFRTTNNSWRAAILVREEFLLRLILAAEAPVKNSRARLCR